MVQFKPVKTLSYKGTPVDQWPSELDLPDTDNQPVDNELQILLPALLRSILALVWAERSDWFLGVNIGFYYDPDRPAVGPDAFLSLGVPTYRPDKDLRLSYVLWHEGVVPQWVLEVVSQKPGKEYTRKMELYADLGVKYYTIYNPKHYRRGNHDPFEVYQLVDGAYERLQGNPVWMPEIGLGIGVNQGRHSALPTRNWLYWYDAAGNQYPSPDRIIENMTQEAQQAQQKIQQAQQEIQQAQQEAQQAQQQLEAERLQREALFQKLRDRGIDPDTL
ncbi:MAG: hypothetical protein DCF15_11520 [Phormidesmis priestleyi]|uniref:Putative restriction endonuclease domain-containing protein n=1 Tax=Phormidesmis priestleyi TaxID=268141 RepID=A0A2W4ZIK4_9CYAN|nr:MAG: hypothetical protein DCF15_11520 [Phormidesmis priestleyi]